LGGGPPCLLTVAAATGEAGQPTSVTLDYLQVKRAHSQMARAMRDPLTISRAASCGRWRRIQRRAARLRGAQP